MRFSAITLPPREVFEVPPRHGFNNGELIRISLEMIDEIYQGIPYPAEALEEIKKLKEEEIALQHATRRF